MTLNISRAALLCSTGALLLACSANSEAPQAGTEPISYIGHGAFFDREGNEIEVTPEFILRTQDWYRAKLVKRLAPEDQKALPEFEEKFAADAERDGVEAMLAKQQSLSWIIAHLPKDKELVRVPGKLRLLERRVYEYAEKELGEEWREKHEREDIPPKPGGLIFLVTTNSGQAYIDECAAAGVPIPPSINRLAPASNPGWTSRGFIPRTQQFIVGTPAEVRTFETGDGVCVALPRYAETDGNNNTDETDTVALDGVICLNKTNGNTCFWDNTNFANPAGFSFPSTTIVPIGVPTTTGGLYQGGGAEIEFAAGGVCTDCHAGENPYVVHPDADLGGGVTMGSMGWDSSVKYIPRVGGTWPQNLLSQSPATVPPGCLSCHTQAGTGGRIPHLYLSTDPFDPNDPADTFASMTWDRDGLSGYCNSVLAPAVSGARATMPQGAGGSMANDAGLTAMRAFCGQPLSAGPSDRGDPHLVTTDGTSYDFQAAGEFTALRNSDSGFELQTRQTPVTTTFTPGPNAHTGLSSCVSLNTAVAARLGKRRISYQSPSGAEGGSEVELRIDGRLVSLPSAGIDFGGGYRIDPLTSGEGIRLTDADGTRVAVTPNFWSSQGYWYLDVNIGHTPAREGIMGTILPGQWLPLAPDGEMFGSMPSGLGDRHTLLNQKFADAWRVTSQSSLFDYAPGTTTLTFTDTGWPSPPGGSCDSTTVLDANEPLKPSGIEFERALQICQKLPDKKAQQECAFDVVVMGDESVLRAYSRSLAARANN